MVAEADTETALTNADSKTGLSAKHDDVQAMGGIVTESSPETVTADNKPDLTPEEPFARV